MACRYRAAGCRANRAVDHSAPSSVPRQPSRNAWYKTQTTIGFADLLAPTCRNFTVESGLVGDANFMNLAELSEIIPHNGGAHNAFFLQALHHLPHRRAAREPGMWLP
jgi:hypothetical protein